MMGISKVLVASVLPSVHSAAMAATLVLLQVKGTSAAHQSHVFVLLSSACSQLYFETHHGMY
jgi:hypothetical protein